MSIEDNNKLIAEFMGGKLVDKLYPNVFRFEGLRDGVLILPKDLTYHISWDWLMPVIDRVEKEGKFQIKSEDRFFGLWTPHGAKYSHNCETRLLSAYCCVLDYIEDL